MFNSSIILVIMMKDTCFDASNIESKDKSIYISLKNNINRGQIKQLTYFCSLVNKKGRIISFVSHMRILVLLAWKNKTPTIGYIQAMRKLPPWTVLPDRKFQKQLKVIKGIATKDKFLEISFYDEQQSWQLECQSKNMAKDWHNLIKNHKKLQQKRQTQERNVKIIQAQSQNSQIIFEIKQRTLNGTPPNLFDQEYSISKPVDLNNNIDVVLQKKESVQELSETSQSYLLQLSLKNNKDKEQWLNKQTEYKTTITTLIQQNKELKAQIQKLKHLNKEIKQQSARLRISKSVLSLLKEQYQKKHLQFTQILNKKNFEIKKLLQKCADLTLVKNSLQKDVKQIKKRQKLFRQNYDDQEVQYDFQFSSSSNENNKQVVQNQQYLHYKKVVERRNTQALMVVNEEHKHSPSQFALIRQNTIY